MHASDDDLAMEESVMPSTEIASNGDRTPPTLINSSALNKLPDLLSPGLPIHSLGAKISVSSTPKVPYLPSKSNGRMYDSDSDDAMDIEPRTSRKVVQVRMPPPPRFPPLSYSSSKTGLVYDTAMRFHAEFPEFMALNDIHPEDPRRIAEIFKEIQQAGLVQGADDLDKDAHDEQCWRIVARPAIKGEICLIHTPEHYEFIKGLQDKPAAELKKISDEHDSIYFNNSTYLSATLAAGGAIEACRAVVRGDVRNAVAIIRPPGHHAESDSASGFCIFNNVPIATRVCQKDFPETCRKVLILDWDVHHGNGVQHAFYDDPNVLYISLHVFRGGDFYPNLPDGNSTFDGEGNGLGRNVNIPWADAGMGDAEYIYAFHEVVMPIATEFDPDLVIISAGFDAAEGDVLGGCHVTPACYAHMTHMLMRLAAGKIAVCLEGGYNLRSIAKSALAVTRTLMLQPPERLADTLDPCRSAVLTIEQVKRQHSRHWKCLHPKHIDKTKPGFLATKRLHDVIREWQSQTLAEEQRMIPLMVNKTGIAQTFEHNVIATSGFMDQHPLLVIFHDPPNIRVEPDPITGKVELHNSWLTDGSKDYIGWAIDNGFQVVDVNIPKVVSFEDDDGGFASSDAPEVRIQQTRDLAAYIWENYIEPHNASQVFFLGIGSAYLGLVDLLGTNENCTEEGSVVHSLIGFLSDTTLQSIKRPTDDNIGAWYHAHSMIFVEHDHPVWDPARSRKLRRKWGKLIRSPKSKLDDMLIHHQAEVQDYLLDAKSEFEAQQEDLKPNLAANNHLQGGLKSPPRGYSSPYADGRQTSVPGTVGRLHMPKMGFFTVNPRVGVGSPSSPKSPLRNDFRRV